MARLEIETGGERREVSVSGIVTIGRKQQSSVHIDDPGISRTHARLYHDGNAWFLEDLESRSGTFLNGKKLSRTGKLNNGDTFSIGKSRIYFSLEDHSFGSKPPQTNEGKWIRKPGSPSFLVKGHLYLILFAIGVITTAGFRFAFIWIFDNHFL